MDTRQRIPADWPFHPCKKDMDDLNALRDHWGLPRIENITMAGEWFKACAEIDACAELE